MNYRQFGKTGLKISTLGFGCMRFPTKAADDGTVSVDKEKTFEMLRYAFKHGINYFDTAFTYHNNTSEEILGEALEGLRNKVHITTKQPLFVMHTQADIRKNLESTLKKLRTDYLDFYFIHNINAASWDEIKERKIIKEYEKFRAEGLIRNIGFSYHGNFDAFNEVLSYYPWDVCQVQQNYLDIDREATEEAIFAAGRHGVALVIMEPLRGGGLVKPTAKVQSIFDKYSTERSGVEWAFRHLVNYKEVSCILSGMSTLDQVKDNIELFSKPDMAPNCLSSEEKALLAETKKAYEATPSIRCTGCGYCTPCPQNVSIPDIFFRYNEGYMFENFDQPKRAYMLLKRGNSSASNCVACGLCESKCPQKVSIIEELQRAHQALDGWAE